MHVMKKPLICILLGLSVFLLAGVAQAQGTFLICSDEWCPHNCAPDEEMQGYTIDIARAILGEQGLEVVYELRGWDESIAAAESGECDAIVGAVPSEAPNLVFPAMGIGDSQIRYIARADSTLSDISPETLAQITVGVIEEYVYDEGPFDEHVAANAGNPERVFTASGETPLEDLLGMLMEGSVDLVADDAAVLDYQLWLLKYTDMVRTVHEDGSDEIFLAISPIRDDAQALATAFDAGMDSLRASGGLEAIMNAYGLHDWR